MRMLDLAYNFAKGKVLYAAIVTRIPDAFAEAGRPLTPGEVADVTKTDPGSTARILRTLSALGFVEAETVGAYSLTSLGQLLVSDKDGSYSPQAALLVHMNEPLNCNLWHGLSATLKEGGTSWDQCPESKEFPTIEDYYRAHPESQSMRERAMVGLAAAECQAVLQTYDGFQKMESLMDVGGGRGHLLAAILQRFPWIKTTNFDLPRVIEEAPAIPGVAHVGGDFFKQEELPKAGNIIMKHVLREHDDAACKIILDNCHAALPSGGKLLIVDFVVPFPESESTDASQETKQLMALLEIEAMLVPGRHERSDLVWWDLLGFSGFELSSILHTSVGAAIIEAVRL